MDYVLVTIASILFPYVFTLSGLDYQTYIGVNASMQNTNKYRIEMFYKTSKQSIVSTNLVDFTGYGVRPEFFINYDIPFGRFVIAPVLGFEPLTTGIQYKVKGDKETGSGTVNTVYYTKGPSLGLKLGYSILKSNPTLNGFNSFGFTPYVVAGVVPVSYESESYYKSNLNKRYNFYLGAGSKIDFKSSWSIYLQYKYLSFDTCGSNLSSQIKVKESEFQLGAAYWLKSRTTKIKLDQDDNYNEIINVLNDDNTESNSFKNNSVDYSTKNIKESTAIYENNKKLKEKNEKAVKKTKEKKSKDKNLNLDILDSDFNF